MTDLPARKMIDSGKALQKLKPPAGQDFCVMAYVLSSEVKEGMYGMWIVLGCYRTEDKAKQYAQHIVQTTGHPNVVWAPTGQWRPLTDKVDLERTSYVEITPKPPKAPLENKMSELLKQEDMKREALAAEQKRIREEILEEQKRAEDPTTIDYYIKLWYLIIRNKAKLDEYQAKPTDKQQMQAAEKIFSERIQILRELASKRPDMEMTWLEILRDRMIRRREEKIYEMIATSAAQLKAQIFPNVPKRVEATVISDSPHHKPKTPPAVEAPSQKQAMTLAEIKSTPLPEVKAAPIEVDSNTPMIPEAPELVLRPAKPKGPIVKKQVETIESRKP